LAQPVQDAWEAQQNEAVEMPDWYSSLDGYLTHLENDPRAFEPIAERTLYPESLFQLLVDEASSNGGVLRAPQFERIERMGPPQVRAYLSYRALSSGLRALESDWRSRAAGVARASGPVDYEEWVDALGSACAVHGQRPNGAPQTSMDRLLVADPADRLSSIVHSEEQLLELYQKSRLLDVVKTIESRLSVMALTGHVDVPLLRRTLSELDNERVEMQRMATRPNKGPAEDLSPADARSGLNIVLQLQRRVEDFIRRH
jgi:hypothetical protein